MKRKLLSVILSLAVVVTMMPMQQVEAKVKTSAKVSSQASLNKALKNNKLRTITISTEKSKSFVIKKGSHKKVKLIVCAPNSKITNKAKFNTVTIKNDFKKKWIEQAKGNDFIIDALAGDFVVREKSNVKSVKLVKEDNTSNFKIDGILKNLSIEKVSKINIRGKSKNAVPVNIKDCEDVETQSSRLAGSISDDVLTEIKASAKVNVKANSHAEILLLKGAEDSKIQIANQGRQIRVINNTEKEITVVNYDGKKMLVGVEKTLTINDYNKTGKSSFKPIVKPKKLDYLCLRLLSDNGSFGLTKNCDIPLQYSFDKSTWEPLTSTVDLSSNKIAFIRASEDASNINIPVNGMGKFTFDGEFTVSGNIMSLLDPSCEKTSLSENAFKCLFSECTGLISADALELPATILSERCYQYMFEKCTNLKEAPKELPANNLAEDCYGEMFDECGALVKAPKLPAENLAEWCYYNMFWKCIALENPPELKATNLKTGCYAGMFGKCSSLKTAPELPAETLQANCYSGMFSGCSSLENAPYLPAQELVSACYNYMFEKCTNLNYIKSSFTEWKDDCTREWVNQVSSTGTFITTNDSLDSSKKGINNIPAEWDFSRDLD